jgi:NADPH-dependent 2,4-dienoyl-CoA reductase/sulfur reductase-like enzyme
MNRRDFLGATAIGLAAGMVPVSPGAAPLRRVVVVGGGMAGATAAKYLRLWSGGTVDVTLVEPSSTYVSNIMSNLVVTGQLKPSVLNFNWTRLAANHGVRVVRGTVTAVTPGGSKGTWKVTYTGAPGGVRYCDRVVVAPGVSFDRVASTDDPGSAAAILHAWKAGPQTLLLRDRLAAMAAGGTVVMSIPKAPYRCPPGPYERACVIADVLKRRKPGSRLIVLDANPDIVAEKENFSAAFSKLYRDVLTYLPGRVVRSVSSSADAPGGSVTVDVVVADASGTDVVVGHEVHAGNLLNVIPPHRAGKIARTLGLADPTGFAPVDGRTFESTVPDRKGIHVIGDASRTTLPKAGHVGNQGAKICADAILRSFDGVDPYPTPVANSACFSPVSSTAASWLTAVFQYQKDPATGAWRYVPVDQVTGLVGATEAAGPTREQFEEMFDWYRTLMRESFS